MLVVIAVAFIAAAGGYLLRDSQDLEQEWAHCVDKAQGYDVEYPSDWYVSRGRAACSFFQPEPFTVPEASDFTGAALEVATAQESFDDVVASLIDARYARTELREEVTLNGRRGFRLELVATGEGLEERGTRSYGYVFRRASGPPILVQTFARPGERLRHRQVVDHAALTLATFAPATAAVPGLPAAVAEKREAIRAAAEAGDEDALRTLIDPDEFNYTFGGDVPGGPLAFWESLRAETGVDPVEILARVLTLPYTLSQGIYVWPFAYDKTIGELSAYERELLGDLLPDGAGDSGYLGWRAGIRPDGRWVFFVAGD